MARWLHKPAAFPNSFRGAAAAKPSQAAPPAGTYAPVGDRAHRGRNPHDEGVAALEFAIIAPVFVLMLFALFVYGIYFATWIAITEAASEGARASVAGLSTSQRTTLATAQVNNFFSYYAPMLNISHATVLAQQAPGTGGGAFQVKITYDFTSFGFSGLSGLVPLPTAKPSVTITVSNGG